MNDPADQLKKREAVRRAAGMKIPKLPLGNGGTYGFDHRLATIAAGPLFNRQKPDALRCIGLH